MIISFTTELTFQKTTVPVLFTHLYFTFMFINSILDLLQIHLNAIDFHQQMSFNLFRIAIDHPNILLTFLLVILDFNHHLFDLVSSVPIIVF